MTEEAPVSNEKIDDIVFWLKRLEHGFAGCHVEGDPMRFAAGIAEDARLLIENLRNELAQERARVQPE